MVLRHLLPAEEQNENGAANILALDCEKVLLFSVFLRFKIAECFFGLLKPYSLHNYLEFKFYI